MKRRLQRASLVAWLSGGLVAGVLGGCDPEAGDETLATPDARIATHRIEAGTPTREGLAYIDAVAKIHAEVDGATDVDRKVAALRRGLALPVPGDLPEAEVLRLELATRMGETLATHADGVAVALDLLEPMLAPERSLPLDRATARALVTLGDLAVSAGDDALAAGSYARAIRVMSSLRKEIER